MLTGVVFAPNGTDPLPNVRAYAAEQINPYPANYCDKCVAPIDPALASAISAPDGTFTLNLDNVPAGPSITFAVQIGRFRKHTTLPVTACQTATVPAAARTLPGNSAAGDIPKIAVSSGNADHLDSVLKKVGITEYDCYEGRKNKPGTSTSSCQQIAGTTIADVIQNATTLDGYHMAFLSCAPGAYKYFTTPAANGGNGNDQATMTANTQAWVANGGRLFAPDTAYDYIAQAFPSNSTWQGPAGTPPPGDGANIGCSPPDNTTGPETNYTVTVDDPLLVQWLDVGVHVLPHPPPSPANVSVLGFYNPWSTINALPPATHLIANGTLPLDLSNASSKCFNPAMQTPVNVPLTTQFDVSTCGRVVFSSYHTDAGASATSAQQRIMEYLIFDAAFCTQ